MKLLLIDDELACIEAMERTLKPAGHECVLFENPLEALETFKKEHFDVVITDFKMPEMNGIEVLKEIRKLNPNTHVIILTGYANINNAIDSVNSGAYAFFRKPVDVKDFIETISKSEEELKNNKNKEVDLKRLANEYKKLKYISESLLNIIEQLTPGNKE